ncbi:MAG: carbohydrate porin [Stigonema ocellatum SAG 48.90 = DSM 106950]|nr:carbohydrate porin [Stigonema ocellatum SAG 48.90 = DSM 106950]
MAQVNSVSELSDVQPTDWAFQALQSLVEKYGCITGYPNGAYRGNRVMTRYEFAAGLNACLNKVTDLVSRQDLATLQKLREEFAGELATLRKRVDAVEAKTAELEPHQFSTTTKLNGSVVIAAVNVFTGNNARGQKINSTPILGDRIRLDFDTSFTGKDQLKTRLQATNLDALSGTSTFTPEGDLRFGGSTYSTDNNNNVALDTVSYTFPLGEKTKVVIEAYSGTADDFADTVNSDLDGNGDSGALSNFGTHNPIYNLVAGSGIVINHEFSENLELTLGYLVSEPNDPSQKNGLFNGPYGVIGQLTIKPSENFNLGLTYVNSYNADLTAGSNRANLRSALLSNTALLPSAVAGGPSNGNQSSINSGNATLPPVLENFRGDSLATSSNSYGVEVSYQISPKFVLGGWVGYTNTRTLSKLGGVVPRGQLDIWNYAITLAFPDLGKKGSLGGIIVGMEPKVTAVSSSLRSVIGTDPNTSYHIEPFYQYHLTDNIAITPGIIYLTAPDHNNRNASSVTGVIRATFTF